jgi:putative spermidine/putrescine transport system permease protein
VTAIATPNPVRRQVFGRLTPYLLSLPALVILGFVLGPVVGAIQLSLTAPDGSFSFVNYADFWGDPFYLEVVGETLFLGLQVVVLTMLLAFPIALYLQFSKDVGLKKVIILTVIAPLLMSVVVRCYGLKILLGPASPLTALLGQELLFTKTAVLIGFCYTFMPYMLLPIVTALSRFDPAAIGAARSLGAGSFRIVGTIILPAAKAGLVSGAIIVFIMTLTAIPIPLLLGGTSTQIVMTFVYQQILSLFNWPLGYAISFGLVAVVLIIGLVARALLNLPGRRART